MSITNDAKSVFDAAARVNTAFDNGEYSASEISVSGIHDLESAICHLQDVLSKIRAIKRGDAPGEDQRPVRLAYVDAYGAETDRHGRPIRGA